MVDDSNTTSPTSALSDHLKRGSTPKPIECSPQAGGDAGVKGQEASEEQNQTPDQSRFDEKSFQSARSQGME